LWASSLSQNSPVTRESRSYSQSKGSDEIFGGYRLYVPDSARESYTAWAQSIVDLPEPKMQELHGEQEQTYVKFLDVFGSESTNRGDNVAMRKANVSLVNSMASIFSFGLWATWMAASETKWQAAGICCTHHCIFGAKAT